MTSTGLCRARETCKAPDKTGAESEKGGMPGRLEISAQKSALCLSFHVTSPCQSHASRQQEGAATVQGSAWKPHAPWKCVKWVLVPSRQILPSVPRSPMYPGDSPSAATCPVSTEHVLSSGRPPSRPSRGHRCCTAVAAGRFLPDRVTCPGCAHAPGRAAVASAGQPSTGARNGSAGEVHLQSACEGFRCPAFRGARAPGADTCSFNNHLLRACPLPGMHREVISTAWRSGRASVPAAVNHRPRD